MTGVLGINNVSGINLEMFGFPSPGLILTKNL